MTPQMRASLALTEWQRLRNAGLTPEQRLDALMADYFQPPIDLDRYQDQLNAVAAEMA